LEQIFSVPGWKNEVIVFADANDPIARPELSLFLDEKLK